MFTKLGESIQLQTENIYSFDKIASDNDLDIENRMLKFANQLKVIAPQAKDFLYFTCVMMHAAEAAILDEDGNIRKDAKGNLVEAKWEKVGGGVKWSCSDQTIRPYKNNNSDIFPESELKLAYKKWVGRPLCLDHKSDSVDKIRGVIVDTVWDEKRKRIIALCALDKKNYPDLAHKVASGIAANVSMGTAVGRAVCTECQTVARTEKDFCTHMRGRTCYGEINLDLSPIELSLVVNGADPKAKVKHVIAQDLGKAAELLSGYLQIKESSENISTHDLEGIKKGLQQLQNKIDKLIDTDDKDDTSDVVGPTRSTNVEGDNIQASGPSTTNLNIPEPIPTYASELQRAILGAQVKIAQLQENYNRLSSFQNGEDLNMRTKKNAYFQGTVEPKLGDRTYDPDTLNEKARMMDKQMVGAGDFPGVGEIEGLYPGITQDDKDLKKTLQRLADEEERSMFREAALKKAKANLLKRKAYFQGTTEPTNYKADPLNEEAREEDKQMVGKSPFPGVGKIDSLYGDDMDVKEKLSRASLSAKFVKAFLSDGRIDKKASRWIVYANNKPILTASVNQITNGNASTLYGSVATKKFGQSLLSRIQRDGFQVTASSLLKSAQEAAAAAPPAPAAPPPPPDPAPVAGDDELQPPDVVSGDVAGESSSIAKDVKDLVTELADLTRELENKIEDLEGAQGPVEQDAKKMEAEKVKPASEKEFEDTAAPKTTASLKSMQKTVNGMISEGIEEVLPSLKSHAKEVRVARDVYLQSYASMNSKQRQYLNALTVDAVKDARAALEESSKLLSAVVKYAYGTAEIEKRAQMGDTMNKPVFGDADDAMDKPVFGDSNSDDDMPSEELSDDEINEIIAELKQEGAFEDESDSSDEEDDDDCYADADDSDDEDDAKDKKSLKGKKGKKPVKKVVEEDEEVKDESDADDEDDSDDEDESDADDEDEDDAADEEDEDDLKVELEPNDLSKLNASDRASLRVKLAQKGLQGLLGFEEAFGTAHPKGSPSVSNIDKTEVSAKFHTIKDLKKEMLDLANMPPKVRKQAEQIQQLVQAGQLPKSDVEQLVSHGVDAQAVKYWKEMWGDAKDSDSNEFAKKLTEEHSKIKSAEDLEVSKVRIKRAYQLANEMHSKGVIDASQVDQQVEEILKWNNEGFDSMKRIIARQPNVVKKASIPSVGMLSDADVILPSAELGHTTNSGEGSGNLKGVFDNYFANRKF